MATGLTLVQRARIRRALESGGILDPPTFLQRYGPAPAWVTGRDDPIVTGGASSGRESGFSSVEGSQVLVEFLSLQGGRLAEWLGIQTVVWRALSVASRVFQGEGWVRMMLQLQDTGRSEGVSSGQVEVQVDSGSREIGWRLVAGAICGGSSDLQDPSDSAAQFGGSSDLQDPSDFAAQFGGSSDFQDQSDFAAQFGGSSSSQKGSGQLSSGGPVVRQVSRPARESGAPEIPTPSVQVGGSSSSHGMQVPSFESTGFSYEDYVSVEGSLDAWPMAGTWLKVHYLMQIFSSVGEVLLEMLGLRSRSWLLVRGTSSAVRIGLYGAVVDYLRNGHEAWRYQGPQWVIAVEEFLLSGSRVTGSGDAGLAPVGVPGPRVRPIGFPYVEGPPGVVSHYLWTVFMTVGSLVLDLLGDRVSSWGYLRATADGFRSSVTMALIVWLRRTHQLYTARSQETYDAAEAYMQRGEIQFPFAQQANVEPAVVDSESDDEEPIDERPLGPRERGPRVVYGPCSAGVAGGIVIGVGDGDRKFYN